MQASLHCKILPSLALQAVRVPPGACLVYSAVIGRIHCSCRYMHLYFRLARIKHPEYP